MEAPFYPEVLGRRGIHVVVPSEEERRWIHAIYTGELLRGEFHDDTRRELVAIVERLHQQEGLDGVILGGTELPLLMQRVEVARLPALDTTSLHVDAIVRRLRDVAPGVTE
jgi:aspartate racemase